MPRTLSSSSCNRDNLIQHSAVANCGSASTRFAKMSHRHQQQQQQQENLIDFSPVSSGTSTPMTSSQTQSAASSTYGFGVGAALTGLWRRLSSNDALQTHSSSSFGSLQHSSTVPSSRHHSRRPTGNGDGVHSAYVPANRPPRRTPSPLIMPSLEPLALSGYRDDTGPQNRLLSKSIAEEIRTFLPERLKIGDDWKLVYSLYQNGSSLATLYKLCDEYRGRRVGFVLVVRDGKEGTFGAYLTEAPHPAASYYGTGECFLWRASVHVPLPPPPSEDTTDLISMRSTTIASPTTDTSMTNGDTTNNHHLGPDTATKSNKEQPLESIRFQNFAYTGINDYCMFCETKFLSVGGGEGGSFGLWLDDSFSRGHSGPCDTFCNQALSNEGEKFEVLGVEMWVVGA